VQLRHSSMKIRYSWQFCFAFMAFVFVFGQLHEMTHLTAAYIVTGHPGIQVDFNLWTLCTGCTTNPLAWVATVFGPIFSYLMMWWGFFLLRSEHNSRWQAGFVLVMGNLAFARIFTAGMGGGDETTVLKVLLAGQPIWLIKAIGFALAFSLAFPPVYMCYKRMINKRRLVMMAVYCIIPLLIMMPYEFIFLTKLLKAGILSQTLFLGVPAFIYFHTVLMACVILILKRPLFITNIRQIQLDNMAMQHQY